MFYSQSLAGKHDVAQSQMKSFYSFSIKLLFQFTLEHYPDFWCIPDSQLWEIPNQHAALTAT